MKLQVVGERVLVKPTSPEPMAGRIIRPAHFHDRPTTGTIVQLGDDVQYLKQTKETLSDMLTPGDVVAFGPFAGKEIVFNFESFLILERDEILGRVLSNCDTNEDEP